MDLTPIKSLIENWANREPAAGIWLVVVAAIVLGATFMRSPEKDPRAWAWIRRLGGATVQALGYIALLGMFYFLLDNAYTAFNKVYASFTTGGSLSNLAWQQWRDRYGSDFSQQDLNVKQYVTVEAQEAIQSDDPAATPVYRTTRVEQPIAENSITGFDGYVTIKLTNVAIQANGIGLPSPVDLANGFNGYQLTAYYEYDIVNPTDQQTRVEYRFPVSIGTGLYQDYQVRVGYNDVHVRVNGEEFTSYQVSAEAITWEDWLNPGERDVISIGYRAKGMDGYVFYVAEQREVTNFSLTIALNTDSC
jgi:hypothetical protein